MTVYDLNEDQLRELKQMYYADKTGRDLAYYELANIDMLVTNEEVQRRYDDVLFVPDDFFCTAGEEEERTSLSQELGEALQILADLHRYRVVFSNPGLSSTEAKVKNSVTIALRELNKAYNAALELGY